MSGFKNLRSAIRAPFMERHGLASASFRDALDYSYDNGFTLKWRNAADTADVSVFGVNSSDRISFLSPIDFREITMQTDVPIIRAGTYTTPIAFGAADQSLIKLYYSQTADTGTDLVAFFYAKSLGDAGCWGENILAESNNLGSPGAASLGASMLHAGLVANAYVGACAGGAAQANMVGAWCKVYADVTSHVTNGARVAAIWLDNQMSCTVTGGEEFTIFASTGGTVPRAVIGLATTSGGWASLLSFDAAAAAKPPLSALTVATQSGASNHSLIIDINGTPHYIPVFDTAT